MANFMIRDSELVLIDFGMATFYVDGEKQPILSRKDSGNPPKTDILGTLPYISIHIHQGEEYTRRDDMISLGYMFLFMVFGNGIFWNKQRESFLHNLPQTNTANLYNQYVLQEKSLENILEKIEKIGDAVEEELSWCCKSYLQYAYRLEFYEKPSYHVEWLLQETESIERNYPDNILTPIH
jgi:serine/threonine protein kinase